MSTGPHPTAGPQPIYVAAGLGQTGYDPVITLTVESPLYRTPITVQLSDEQARRLRDQLTSALLEKSTKV